MKQITQMAPLSIIRRSFLAVAVILSSLFTSLAAFAQSVPEKVDVDVNTGGETMWYGQPWVWAVGVAVFIVIIIAITRGGNRTNA